MTGGSEGVAWDGETPWSPRFDDVYYSRSDGLAEARAVFLVQNGLPERLADGFHVAELGFGTGLNLAALLHASPGEAVRFTSFEAYPMRAEDADRALSRWPELDGERRAIVGAWPSLLAGEAVELPGVEVRLIVGDANETLPAWAGRADAWFLDGFSPADNPELWTETLMRAVFERTAPGGTFATYTAAGHVRRALATAGFEVERVPGALGKRHMSRGRRP